MKYFFLVILFVSAQSWATEDENVEKWFYRPLMVSSGGFYVCTLDAEGVRCFGNGRITKVPPLKNPRQLSSGHDRACVIDDEGVKCWGYYGQTKVPSLKNPRQVSAGYDHTCALDDEGVKCWRENNSGNEFGQTNVPPLKNPKQVSAGGSHTCAIDDEGVKCWGDNRDYQTIVPSLKNPIQVSAGLSQTCALDDEGAKCWGSDYGYKAAIYPLKSPSQISAGFYANACALDVEGVKCWGFGYTFFDSYFVPVPENLSQVSVGRDYMCGIDSESLKCWETPHRDEDRYPNGGMVRIPTNYADVVHMAASRSSAARAEYFKANTEFAYKTVTRNELKYYYFLCLLSSPAIVSADSSYFTDYLIPQLEGQIAELQQTFGYPEDINNFQDDEKSRGLAIMSIQSALLVSLNFLTPASQATVQDSIRAAGAALADPMNNQKVNELVKHIDSLNSEKQILKASPKIGFLVDSLELAANWLREKVM
jgi:hypothetical protein